MCALSELTANRGEGGVSSGHVVKEIWHAGGAIGSTGVRASPAAQREPQGSRAALEVGAVAAWLHVKLMSAASEAELVSRCTVGLRVGFALPQAVKVVPSAGMVGSGVGS